MMNTSLLSLCERFIKNRDIFKSVFKFENLYMPSVSAAMYCAKGKEPNEQTLRDCKKLLKDNVSAFSNFRSIGSTAIISMLSLDNDPSKRLNNAQAAHLLLKEHFHSSTYLPLAAMLISELSAPSEYKAITDKMSIIYKMMKEEHPMLTSSDDIVFIALLAYTDLKPGDIIIETERCYEKLGKTLFSGNAYQALSHVLALYPEKTDIKCERVGALRAALKTEKLNFGESFELPILGVLAMLPQNAETVVSLLKEVSEYLAKQKGYGFSIPKRRRLLHAAVLVSIYSLSDNSSHTLISTALGSTVSLLIAQQTALIAATTASIAASNAARSAN